MFNFGAGKASLLFIKTLLELKNNKDLFIRAIVITYTLRVIEIRKETEDTITLCFKQPALRKIRYKAGQYLSLIFRINGRRYVRPYSFSSAPLLDTNIEVTVKRVPNGIVSNHIHDRVKVGDVIEVFEPMGDFIYKPKENIKNIYFWGVGSGITPLISLIKEVLTAEIPIKVNLIYGNRNFDTIIFSELIKSLSKNHPDQLKVWYFLSRLTLKNSEPYIIEGRISKDAVLSIVDQTEVMNTMHYICGPTGLKESVKKALRTLNIPSENILSEDFELAKNPNDFRNIHTQTIKLRFNNAEYDLEVIKGKSILETALDAGVELPYSCQTGNCSTCKAACLTGQVKMIGLNKDRSDLASNEYLLCCSHPLTNDVCVAI